MTEVQGVISPFSVGKNYSDTAPGTEGNPRPADRETESAGAGVTTQPGTGDTHESGQNETAGGAETGQAPLQ